MGRALDPSRVLLLLGSRHLLLYLLQLVRYPAVQPLLALRSILGDLACLMMEFDGVEVAGPLLAAHDVNCLLRALEVELELVLLLSKGHLGRGHLVEDPEARVLRGPLAQLRLQRAHLAFEFVSQLTSDVLVVAQNSAGLPLKIT